MTGTSAGPGCGAGRPPTRERAVWEASGRWQVEVLPSSRFVRRQVREWASHEAALAEAREAADTLAGAARARLEG